MVAAERKDCQTVAQKLANLDPKLLRLQNAVIELLQAANKDHPLAFVGLELTPAELASDF